MPSSRVDRALLQQFLARLGAAFIRSARLFLVGETTQVFEGWRAWTARVEFAAEVAPSDRSAFDEALREVSIQIGVETFEESPGDVIPLPADHESRARAAGGFGALQVYHFDPCSVAFRLIARGDEPDYHAVLTYLEHGWLEVDEMNALLADLLPQFSSETIQQDPAEFRRKYKGLLQMWRAAQAA